MASASECSQTWERISSPVIVHDKRKDLWRIRLMYTRPRQKPQRVRSTTFKTLEDAEAAQHQWRLSWEKGRRGKPVTSVNLPAGDTLSGSGPEAAASAMLPKGKSLNSMGILNGAQNQAYKKSRREGYNITKAQWMQSQTLTDREKRCITKSWHRRAAKVSKRLYNRSRYLRSRAEELGRRVDSTVSLIARLRNMTRDDVTKLLYRDEYDGDADVVTPQGEAHASENVATSTTISSLQLSLLYRQTALTRDVLEQQRDRDMLQLQHYRDTLRVHGTAEAECASASSRAKRRRAETDAEDRVRDHLDEAELIRLRNSLVHIAEDVVGDTAEGYKPSTILSWVREFVRLGGYFKRDGRGMHERDFILDQEDLQLQLLSWLKSEKRVSTRRTQEYMNKVLFDREGGMHRLALFPRLPRTFMDDQARLQLRPCQAVVLHRWARKG